MSRSIHRTRRELAEAKERDYADAEQRERELQAIAEQLEKKRRIKGQVQSERRIDEGLRTPVSPEAIPINVRDESDFVHYPAGVEDIRELMRRLPVGVLDGIRSIDLCLGREDQADMAEEWPNDKADPFVGRVGVELWTGVFSGRTLGRYHGPTARIRLF